CTRLITSLYMDYLSKDTEKVDSAYTIEFSQASILENNIEPGMDEREQQKLYNFPGYQHAQKEMLEWQKNIIWNKYLVW
ncbi:MAG TPA: hypothetical protein VHO70_20210, partial [Chitinispirillaceae bacterium]|nr:hypothetical protein [Chitinispirillaceae bacterium]